MTTKDEALKLALEALDSDNPDIQLRAAIIIRGVLAQPEPPPECDMTKPRLDQGPDYERGFIDGMQHQMQSSVDKAVNRMAQRPWVGIVASTKEKAEQYAAKHFYPREFWIYIPSGDKLGGRKVTHIIFDETEAIEAKLKEKNT